MKKLFFYPSICILSLCVPEFLGTPCAKAQDDLMDLLEEDAGPTDQKVHATFKTIKIINAQTIETIKAKTMIFRITHRFGNIGSQSGGGVHTLYGFDNASNIRFSLDYGITDKLLIGIGRNKFKEHLDGSIKYKILEQTTDNKVPLTVAVYSSMAFTPMIAATDLTAETSFGKNVHRLSYTSQAIIARKFSSRLSLEILPTYSHRNYVAYFDENDLFSLGFAGRFKITQRTAIVADYFYTFSKKRKPPAETTYYAPLGIGIEIETGGHVFHINLTNSAGIIENDYIPNTTDSWEKGGYKFGFNIARVFYL